MHFKVITSATWTFLFFLMGCENTPKLSHDVLAPIIRVYDHENASSYSKPSKDDSVPIPFTDKRKGCMGYKNKNGKIVIEPQFTQALPFSEHGIADVYKEEGWYKINKTGEILFKSYFFDNGPDYYVSDLMRYEGANGKIGFADRAGQIVISSTFDFATPFFFSEPITVVCNGCRLVQSKNPLDYPEMKGGQWGAIDKQGYIVVPIQFDGWECIGDESMKPGKTIAFQKDGSWHKLYRNSQKTYVLVSSEK